MKINITVAGSAPFSIDVEKSITIADFKELIVGNEHFPKGVSGDSIKIIHFGKFLDDPGKTLEDYKVAENARIIIYVNKKPAAQPATSTQQKTVAQQNPNPSTSSSSATSAPIVPPTSTSQPQQNSAVVAPAPVPATAAPATGSSLTANRPIVPPLPPQVAPAAAPSLPPVDPEKLQQMLSMGFNENDSRKALISANGNLELAVDYVLSGNIPEPVARPPQPQQPNPGFGGGMFGGLGVPSPAELQQLMLYLQQNDPETYEQVRANPALLAQLLEQARMYLGAPAAGAAGAAGAAAPVGGSAGAPAVGALAAPLTPEETESVRRISELTGLDMDRCKVVFVRLGRNPDVACNVILESSDRLRIMSPMEIDYMFISMQQRAGVGARGHGHGDAGYDSDDGSSMSEGGSDDGNEEDDDDDDFYL